MFLDPYDYDMDIAVQREEAYEDGFENGFGKGEEKGEKNGRQNKAIEDATNLIKEKISLCCAYFFRKASILLSE